MANLDISVSIAGELEEEVNREARVVAINFLRGIVKLTPVDTGRAKGNWFVGINLPNRSIDQNRRAGQAVSEGIGDIESAKTVEYPTVVISNNLPYIQRLNNGHSQQAPVKFVETEIARVVNASRLDAR